MAEDRKKELQGVQWCMSHLSNGTFALNRSREPIGSSCYRLVWNRLAVVNLLCHVLKRHVAHATHGTPFRTLSKHGEAATCERQQYITHTTNVYFVICVESLEHVQAGVVLLSKVRTPLPSSAGWQWLG